MDLQLDTPEKLFSLPAKSFDAITMWHVLEHVHELHAYIKVLKELLKPAGNFLLLCPIIPVMMQKFIRNTGLLMMYRGTCTIFHQLLLNTLLSLHGMRLDIIKPMWYDSFYVSMLSEKYKTGKQHYLKAVITGMISNCEALLNVRKCSSVIYVASELTLPKDLIPNSLSGGEGN